MKRNNKKGFTIVELVIVIAVIAILSAVLIPTFGNVTQRAQAAADQANARNVYTKYLANVDSGADIDYVLVDEVYYSVANDFKPATIPTTCISYLNADDDTVKYTGTHVNTDTPVDNKCDVCGETISAQ